MTRDLPRSGRVEAGARRAAAARSTELLRLGFVMALAMTLHNLPEGFAVCACGCLTKVALRSARRLCLWLLRYCGIVITS